MSSLCPSTVSKESSLECIPIYLTLTIVFAIVRNQEKDRLRASYQWKAIALMKFHQK